MYTSVRIPSVDRQSVHIKDIVEAKISDLDTLTKCLICKLSKSRKFSLGLNKPIRRKENNSSIRMNCNSFSVLV